MGAHRTLMKMAPLPENTAHSGDSCEPFAQFSGILPLPLALADTCHLLALQFARVPSLGPQREANLLRLSFPCDTRTWRFSALSVTCMLHPLSYDR